jgi:hypothetical protein
MGTDIGSTKEQARRQGFAVRSVGESCLAVENRLREKRDFPLQRHYDARDAVTGDRLDFQETLMDLPF